MHNALSRINFRKITNLLEYVFRSMAKKLSHSSAPIKLYMSCVFSLLFDSENPFHGFFSLFRPVTHPFEETLPEIIEWKK